MAKTKERPAPAKGPTAKNGTLFVCEVDPNANEVFLVGEFNNWNPKADRMTKRKNGFQKRLYLEPGEYQYKFIIDGQWVTDPRAPHERPNDFGTMNSIVRV